MLKLGAAIMLIGSAASAQWIHYPTAGVPHLQDGKVNLSAPPPKASDGKPDLTGIWFAADTRCEQGFEAAGGTCLETGAPRKMNNIRADLPYQPWAEEAKRERQRAKYQIDPHVNCLPLSFPRAYSSPHMQKIVQTPGLILILTEWNAQYRQIFTDGRPLPVDPQPSWFGYSVGKWEGDTLVVTSIGFREDTWLDGNGNLMTDHATMTERFRRTSYGALEIDVKVDDPSAYKEPWSVQLKQAIVLDTEMIDEICAENEKDLGHMPRR